MGPRIEPTPAAGDNVNSITRRSFVGQAAVAGLAAIASPAAPANADRIYHPADWKMASFDQLLKQKAEAKQMWDVTAIDEGSGFDHMVNALDGLHFGFGIPEGDIKLVAALRSQATVLNFGDSLWEKYKIGEQYKVDDPKTGKPAIRNIFYASAAGNPPKYTTQDPNEEKSFYRDASIQALQSRGVQLLACHMAIQSIAGFWIKKLKLTQTVEEVVTDIQSNLVPGVIVVPAMVAAIAMLQNKGHFSYIRM
jgi:intracellular sulfur oxidation DsrE/DsrF family protein